MTITVDGVQHLIEIADTNGWTIDYDEDKDKLLVLDDDTGEQWEFARDGSFSAQLGLFGTIMASDEVSVTDANDNPAVVMGSDGGFHQISQDLSALSLGSGDNGRMFRHDGSASITADGGTTSQPGYYVWDNSVPEWKSVVQF